MIQGDVSTGYPSTGGFDPRQEFADTYQMQFQSRQTDDLLRWQLDTEEVLDMIERNLKRLEKDEKTGEWKPRQGARPILNDTGVYDLMAWLRGTLHKVIPLTYLEEKDVTRMAKQIRIGIVLLLYQNYRYYEVDPSYLDYIVNLVDHNCYAVLRKAFKDLQRKHQSEQISINRNENIMQNQRNKFRLFGG